MDAADVKDATAVADGRPRERLDGDSGGGSGGRERERRGGRDRR